MNRANFNTYGALARPPMFFGVPLGFVGGILLFFVVMTLLGFKLLGGKAFFILLMPIPILLVCKTLCRNDDQALSVIGFELMCFFQRRNIRFFNGTFTVVPDRKENIKDTVQYFRKVTK